MIESKAKISELEMGNKTKEKNLEASNQKVKELMEENK